MNRLLVLLLTLVLPFVLNAQVKILFNATKAETAGNADWVIDADQHNLSYSGGTPTTGGSESNPQQLPSPVQSTVTSTTSELYWNGGISAWGIDLVKKGYAVETLPYNGSITYGNSSNPQDLSNYKVFIDCEPNILYTTAEKTALIQFVQNGGGLFMVSDHTISDRNNDGFDSPQIWNDLMSNNGIQSNPFGITFDLANITQTTTNIPNLPGDPILHGVIGDVTSVMWSAGTTITINPTANSSVIGIIYKTNSSFGTTNVMFAYASYGNGKVVAIGDSSPCDDGTGDSGDILYNGWTADAGGNHERLIMNATIWLAGPNQITPSLSVAPVGQNVSALAGSASFSVTSNTNWIASSNQAWCTVTTSGSGNAAISANYSQNTTGISRSANITISVTGLTPQVVTLTQSAPTLSLSPMNQIVQAASNTTSLNITTNSNWAASSNQSWCVVTTSGSGNGFLMANCAQNSTTSPRVANIVIDVIGLSPVTATITQTGIPPELSVTPANQSVSAAAGNTSFTVLANTNWAITCDQTWCTPTLTGSGNGTITVNFLENPAYLTRVSNISISASGIQPLVVSITQAGIDSVPEPTNFPVNFSAQTIHLNWTDATGENIPFGYLIRMSTTGFNSIPAPIDGIPVPDSSMDKNILYGIQEASFGNLNPSTTYYFKIFGYLGSGSNINYKTDGFIPQIEKTTGP